VFYERKGFPLLIEAFAQIAHKHPDTVLRIAGDGPQRSEIQSKVERARLNGRIQLLGPLRNAQVLQEMVWADLFALVGWDEPFGIVHAEAAAAGLPLLLQTTGGSTTSFGTACTE
jgi:glycosyltransferase involved in cell wall biosynthesis